MAKQNYTDEEKLKVIFEICSYISEGKSVSNACIKAKLTKSTYLRWISENDQYEIHHSTAMQDRADSMFEDILKICDSTEDDIIINEDGNPIINHNVIQRDRLRIDARKWILAKMVPKKYGDKVDVTSGGKEISTAPTAINIGIVKPLDE